MESDARWKKVKEPLPFSPRMGVDPAVHLEKLWIVGGAGLLEGAPKDIWSSVDGESWEVAAPQAPFLPRQGHVVLPFRNRLWVVGGWSIKEKGVYSADNDIWSSADGKEWKKEAAGPFPPRGYHGGVVFADRMWIFGGRNNQTPPVDLGDVWSTVDGISWVKASSDLPVKGMLKAVVFQDKMQVFSQIGAMNTTIASSADGLTWTSLNKPEGLCIPEAPLFPVVNSQGLWALNKFRVWSSANSGNWAVVSLRSPMAGHLGAVQFKGKVFSFATNPSVSPPVQSLWVIPASP